jgi:iron complex outermembrane receptor protein
MTPGYGLVNGRVELNKIAGQKINAAFFVNNLLDKKYVVANYSLEREIGFSSQLMGAPRMYGVELRFTY